MSNPPVLELYSDLDAVAVLLGCRTEFIEAPVIYDEELRALKARMQHLDQTWDLGVQNTIPVFQCLDEMLGQVTKPTVQHRVLFHQVLVHLRMTNRLLSNETLMTLLQTALGAYRDDPNPTEVGPESAGGSGAARPALPGGEVANPALHGRGS